MFVVMIRYLKPFEVIEKFVVEHRTYLDKGYASGLLIASGPQVPRAGGVILAKAESREVLVRYFAEDPFLKEGLAEYQFIEFQPVKHLPGFEKFFTSRAP